MAGGKPRRIPRIPRNAKSAARGVARAGKRIKHQAVSKGIATGAEIVIEAGDTFGLWRDIAELIHMMIFWSAFALLMGANIVSPLHIIQTLLRAIDNIPFVDLNTDLSTSSQQSTQINYVFNGDIIDDLANAIASQESGHNYSALNPDSGAMGRYQFMPGTARRYVSFSSIQEFLNSPELQDRAFAGYIAEAQRQAQGLEGCEMARAIASVWYSGRADLRNNTRPQYTNGQAYPSIKDYSDAVASKTNCEKW